VTVLSQEQLQQIEAVVRRAVREEISEAGLRIDGPDYVDMAREDFRFLRKLRTGIDGLAAKIGWALITALLGGVVWLLTLGANAWKGLP